MIIENEIDVKIYLIDILNKMVAESIKMDELFRKYKIMVDVEYYYQSLSLIYGAIDNNVEKKLEDAIDHIEVLINQNELYNSDDGYGLNAAIGGAYMLLSYATDQLNEEYFNFDGNGINDANEDDLK